MARPGTLTPLLALVLLLPAGPSRAASAVPEIHAGPAVFHPAAPKATPAVPRLDFAATEARLPESARHALPGLSAEERRRLESPDARPGGGARPKRPAVRVGVIRALPTGVGFHGLTAGAAPRPLGGGWLERAADANGGWVWTASFSSEGAQALRIQIRDAWLPAGSRVFVYGADGEVFGPYAFDGGTKPEGFWTNTVFASQAIVRVEIAGADPARLALARLSIGSLVHIEHPWAGSVQPTPRSRSGSGTATADGSPQVRPKSDSCFVDASCVSPSDFANIDAASHAAAQLNFVEPDGSFVCSGGLLNTLESSMVPYLLTANHCFSTQAAATSLEAFFDYTTASCNGIEPPPNGFPRTLGSTLLATSTNSDFTFVQLSQDPPDGSVFLGWTTGDYAHVDATTVYRISHPNGRPQFFSKHQVEASPDVICEGFDQGNFLYEQDVEGGTGGGSSGSLALLADLSVIGQELGACGVNTDDDCDRRNLTIDGAFRVTFPSVSTWLAPASPSTCVPSAGTLCLHGGRFQVTADWTKTTGEHGSGTGVVLTDDAAYFWFFSPDNVEMVVKVLDACAISQKFWVFAGGLTNVSVRMTVVDTRTGTVEIYDNPQNVAFAPLQDTKAFACP